MLLDVQRIHWIEAAGNFARLHTPDRTFQIRETLTSLERKLDPKIFVRYRPVWLPRPLRDNTGPEQTHADLTTIECCASGARHTTLDFNLRVADSTAKWIATHNRHT
jgi:LytTr DNA-binding domain